MREIKFRAWIHDSNFRSGWMTYNIYPMLNNEIWIDADICDIDESIEIMQYTGLKDKNGKKIFEGDIVKIFNWGHSDKRLLGIGTVIFDENEGCYNTDPMIIENQYDFYTKCNNRAFEVIGNIYENPELLNK